jgi:hypothetical protein
MIWGFVLRVMRSRCPGMRTQLKRRILLVFAAVVAVTGAMAKEEPPESAAGASKVEAPQPNSERKPVQPAQTFTPTEKIKADSAVSFPVDI